MAITVIFGLMFATLLTLFLIPILYSVFDRKKFTAPVAEEAVARAASENTVNASGNTANGNAGA
jgi:HAE1 family hydrophobic/amphiphilic exporter-1